MRCFPVELRAVGSIQSKYVARKFYHRDLHTKADSKIGNIVESGILDRGNLSVCTSLSKPAWNNDSVCAVQYLHSISFDRFRVNIVDIDASAGSHPGMSNRFCQRFVAVGDFHVFAYESDIQCFRDVFTSISHILPFG